MIDELNININIPEIDFDISILDNGFNNRYLKAKVAKDLPGYRIKYSNALKLAKDIKLDVGIRYNCIVAGNFVFGDFLEAFIVNNNIQCKQLTISTLSLDQNNVDSLSNLLKGNYVNELNLILSDYFYAHERNSLIPYLYERLDIDNKFQLAAAGSHTKIIMFETTGGKKIVIHGSSNLRSSSNIEQFVIEENPDLYDFWLDYHLNILSKYNTIDKNETKKSIRGKNLWNIVNK